VPANGGDVDSELFGGIQQGGIGFYYNFLTINIQSDFISHFLPFHPGYDTSRYVQAGLLNPRFFLK
jgi:hypothetical protein